MIKLMEGNSTWYFNPSSFMYAQVDRDKNGYVNVLYVKFSYFDYYLGLTFEGEWAELNYKAIEKYLTN